MKKTTPNGQLSIDHLEEIFNWVSSVYDLDRLLELIITTATQRMNAKASSLLLVDPKTDKLYFKVATGEKKEDIKTYALDMGQGIAGYVAEKGTPLLIPDVHQDKRWHRKISESIGFETRSIACVPMKLGGRIIGVVELIDKRDGDVFRESDLKILMVFADLAAMAIGKAKQIARVERENRDLREERDDRYQIVGESPALLRAIADAHKVANSDATTLITGESGTGKELIARLIHNAGGRRNSPMIVLNCAALPEALLEDELFGHEKGAYTGASEKKPGKFEIADNGTLFLDEIGEMSPAMQAKLLRVLQEGIFYRVGGNTPISADVRILAATNRDIDQAVADGQFREDLFYRLNVVQIRVPPLRDRITDIPILARFFLKYFRQQKGLPALAFSEQTMKNMLAYRWPGNIRELRNAIERAVVMGNEKIIGPEDLPMFASKTSAYGIGIGMTLEDATHAFKKNFIRQNLENTGGNRSRAARILNIQRTYLSRLIRRYGLQDS